MSINAVISAPGTANSKECRIGANPPVPCKRMYNNKASHGVAGVNKTGGALSNLDVADWSFQLYGE